MESRLEISAANLLHNFDYLEQMVPGKRQFPVLKSNAYGHGIAEVASILATRNPACFLVQTIAEAALVRRVCAVHVVVLGHVTAAELARCNISDIAFTVSQLSLLAELAMLECTVSIHLCLNTGMNREGMNISDLSLAIDLIRANPNLNITGIWSHFADADNPDSSFWRSQQGIFTDALNLLGAYGLRPLHVHLANSAGFLKTTEPRINAFRAGMAGYGFDPTTGLEKLRPALRLVSQIAELRDIQAEDTVGYGRTYKAQIAETIGIIPVGYFEALDTRLSNAGWLLHHNAEGHKTYLPICGRVSMNQTCFRTRGLDLALGDELTVISNETTDKNSVCAIARQVGTIPDEIVTRISATLPIVIV